MPDEATRKRIVLEYAARMNAGDVDRVLELFADDIVFEDPVGITPIVGREAVRHHIAWSIAFKVHETPGRPVCAMDDRQVSLPMVVTVQIPTRLAFRIVSVIEVGDDDLVHRARAFWGLTDTTVGDGSKPTGVAEFMEVTASLARLSTERFGAAGPPPSRNGALP
jgi:steroid delta-isomerase